MQVVQATDGMEIERERVHIIPPGAYLSVDGKGVLRLSRAPERHAARLPFDFLLNSLANTFGRRVVCVVMSGTGCDGSLGLKAVKAKGGLVLAQDAGEADYDGMPRSAIATGDVDQILPAAKMAAILVERERGALIASRLWRPHRGRFTKFCPTSSTSCARRRSMTSRSTSAARWSAMSSAEWRWRRSRPRRPISYGLRRDEAELDQLSREMLINVTGFFRDPAVFDYLAREVIPGPRARSSRGSAAANLDRRLQFRRGDLFAGHVVSRADRQISTRAQTADFRQRRRCRRRRDGSRGPLSAVDRGRSLAGTPRSFLHSGRSRLSGLARFARERRLLGS